MISASAAAGETEEKFPAEEYTDDGFFSDTVLAAEGTPDSDDASPSAADAGFDPFDAGAVRDSSVLVSAVLPQPKSRKRHRTAGITAPEDNCFFKPSNFPSSFIQLHDKLLSKLQVNIFLKYHGTDMKPERVFSWNCAEHAIMIQ